MKQMMASPVVLQILCVCVCVGGGGGGGRGGVEWVVLVADVVFVCNTINAVVLFLSTTDALSAVARTTTRRDVLM
jgi:hypothetical protein